MKKRWIFLFVMLGISILLNIAAWTSSAFCDWYIDHIYPLIVGSYGRLTSLVPFSVGEIMILLGITILIGCLVLGLVTLIFHRKKRLRKAFISYLKAVGGIVIVIFFVMTLNCVLLYHATPLEEGLPGYGKEYTLEDLALLRDYIVVQANQLAKEMPRDEKGEVLLPGGNAGTGEKAREAVKLLAGRATSGSSSEAAQSSGDTSTQDASAQADAQNDSADGSSEQASASKDAVGIYPRFANYSVVPKPLAFSYFVSQQNMAGYFFPFSMESNYNAVMKPMNMPYTMCHELAHTHGYIYEDDANFLAFLACVRSDDPVMQYGGWLGVLNYVNNDFYRAVDKETYYSHVGISRQVYDDNLFLSEETRAEMEARKLFKTEHVAKAADVYVDQTLKANGVKSGKISYNHVVKLLLEYFDVHAQQESD